jgi:hypothetical protein
MADVDEALVERGRGHAALHIVVGVRLGVRVRHRGLKAVFHISPTNALATEIRNRERVLGTTADFRRDLRIRYVDAKPAAPTGENVTSMDDYRDL